MAAPAHKQKIKFTVFSATSGPEWKLKSDLNNLQIDGFNDVKEMLKSAGLQWSSTVSAYSPRPGITLPGFLQDPITKALVKNNVQVSLDFKEFAGGPSIEPAKVPAHTLVVCRAVAAARPFSRTAHAHILLLAGGRELLRVAEWRGVRRRR